MGPSRRKPHYALLSVCPSVCPVWASDLRMKKDRRKFTF